MAGRERDGSAAQAQICFESRPLRRNPFLALAPGDDEYLAYDLMSGRLHRLNPAAALILELSDGSRSAEDLRVELTAIEKGLVWAAYAKWIERAYGEGLFILEGPCPTPPTVRDILSHARALRQDGKVLAAFVCQRHATLLFSCDAGEWLFLGEIAHIIGRRADAREAYERYLELQPDDAEIAHILTGLRDEPAPERAPDRCIEQLYARFADGYENSMCNDLGYQAPGRLIEAIVVGIGGLRNLDMLDLGCGTGLFGRELRTRARRLTGVDLSPEMITHARNTGFYDVLDICEITFWLRRRPTAEFDLIAACDSFIYFGDLRQVVIPAAQLLRRGGWMAFTVERGESEPFRLTDSGRYSHTASHVRRVAEEAGLRIASISETLLRYEYGQQVTGIVAVLRQSD